MYGLAHRRSLREKLWIIESPPTIWLYFCVSERRLSAKKRRKRTRAEHTERMDAELCCNVDVRRNESETRGMRRLSSAKTQIADRMHTFISRRFFIVHWLMNVYWQPTTGNGPIIMHCRFYCLPLYATIGTHIHMYMAWKNNSKR